VTEIRNLEHVPFDIIYTAWEDAFSGYERTRTAAELHQMLQRRGFNPRLSFAVFDGDEMLSFTLNGTGHWQGRPTVYDTGTGTIKKARGRGYPAKLFNTTLPFLKKAGIQQYLLEVLQHNETAVRIYRDIGFRVTREFDYTYCDVACLHVSAHQLAAAYRLADLDLQFDRDGFHDFEPSWQNSTEAMNRVPGQFFKLGVYQGDTLVAYGIIDPDSGDIPQIAVHRDHRRQGIGSAVLYRLLAENPSSHVQVINSDACDPVFASFLAAAGFPRKGKQFEMMLDISDVPPASGK